MAKTKKNDNSANNTAESEKKKIDIETKKDKKIDAETAKNTESKTADRSGQNGDEQATGQADVLKTTQDALAQEKDKCLRLAAEYDNFRKRTAKERESAYTNAKADTVGKLLPVYDSLERALKHECSDEAYYKGIEMTMQQLMEILKDMGVDPIPTVGEPFDPNRHNAVMRIEDPNLGTGIIAEECQKGFVLGEKIIRFSTVVVAN